MMKKLLGMLGSREPPPEVAPHLKLLDQVGLKGALDNCVGQTIHHVGRLHTHVREAEHALKTAEHRFAEGKAGRFWLAIEAASEAMKMYLNSIEVLEYSHRCYHEHKGRLRGELATYRQVAEFADPAPVLVLLRTKIAGAMEHPRFAAEFEKRGMTEILDQGIEAMVPVVTTLQARFERAIVSMGGRVSSS